MSMLAEQRRKQRWTLNPRGKQWSEDSNKYGQKILEKMGWTNGKGLGVNEQGMTEHVRTSFKNDMAGIGFKKDHLDKAWTEHQDSFNDILQKLQAEQDHGVVQIEESKSELSGKSLELRSKQSRARVHYQKFTRGKDVNKYSSKDLANIFGQKELNINKNDKNKNNDEENTDSIGIQDNRGGVITINGGNMATYFMKKNRGFSLTSGNEERKENDSESEPEHVGFGFTSAYTKAQSRNNEEHKESQDICNYAFENPCIEINSPENNLNTNGKSKSCKKRKSFDDDEVNLSNKTKKCKDTVNDSEYKNGVVNDGLNLDCQTNETCNGKEYEVSRVQFGLANSALDLSDEADDKKRVRFNDHVEYSTDSVKKKKSRTTLDKFEVENKKAKKKKMYDDSVNGSVSSGFVNEALDVEEMPEEIYDNEINENKSKKSKKRKGSRQSNLETIVEIPEEDKEAYEARTGIKRPKTVDNTADNCEPSENVSSKKKKKKHKEKSEIVKDDKNDAQGSVTGETISETSASLEKEERELQKDQEDFSKKKKKKKKNKDKDKEQNFEKDENISQIKADVSNVVNSEEERIENCETEETSTAKVKRKKKPKKDNDVCDPITEVVKDISDKENTSNLHENETNKPNNKKHKGSVDESVSNDPTQKTEVTQEPARQMNVQANTPSNSKNKMFHTSSSPWNRRATMSKRLLQSLFHRNSVINFPGSNISEIKGYGADIQ
ncbi:PIN2/TERF1-interacting telomerase inhibitor 1 [Anthophora retusa]